MNGAMKEEYSQKGTLKKLAAVSRQHVWPAGRRWLLQGVYGAVKPFVNWPCTVYKVRD